MLASSFARIDIGSTSSGDWVRAHEALSRLSKGRAAADAEEGRWLLCALRSAAHVHLGFGSFGEYIERLFGYQPRSTQEKLRVAEALEALPAMARSLESGSLSWSAVRELTRVVVAETFALFREAVTQLRRRTGSMLDDDSALLSMARHVLGGPGDAGRASYQIALSVCAQCGSAEQQACGRLVAVGVDVIEQARCDGQHLGYVAAPVANENAAAEGIDRNEDEHARARRGADAGKAPAHLNAVVEGHDAQNGDARVDAEGHTHAGDAHVGAGAHRRDGKALPRPATRAKQTIPPALRRAVLRRDHERCRVPGCMHATFLDLHHLEARCEGGQHELENLIAICGTHHRAAHRGELVITGSATKPHFRHADGNEYGHADRPHTIEAHTQVFSALRQLGFREKDVHAVLGELRKQNDFREASTERLLREALQRLAPPRVKPIRNF